MDFSSSPLFTPDFVYDDGLDFSSFSSPSTFQEPNPSIPITHTENDGKKIICEITKMGDDQLKNKRMKHRETEKQRRQEVTLLFKNLRHILPSQYIKGKRSTPAHVEEAVNYIKDLQKKIKGLSEKRDKIMRSITHHPSSTRECSGRSLESSSSSSSLSSNCCCVGDTHIDVVVRACLNGIEVVASCCFRYKSCLSNVLQVLAQEQCFNVVSCISTRLHKIIIHTIISEVEEGIPYILKEKHFRHVSSLESPVHNLAIYPYKINLFTTLSLH